MPVTIAIQVSDSATAAAVALDDALGKGRYAKAVARVAASQYTRNFERLAAGRHRGLGQNNYYLTAARNTIGTAEGGDAIVTIAAPAGIALRRYGGYIKASGRISPVTGKPITTLAIPRKGGPAEGRVPLDFKTAGVQLRLRVLKSLNRAALIGPDPGTGRTVVYFWLLKSVTFKEDPTVFPADAALSEAINKTLERFARTVWQSEIRRYTNG